MRGFASLKAARSPAAPPPTPAEPTTHLGAGRSSWRADRSTLAYWVGFVSKWRRARHRGSAEFFGVLQVDGMSGVTGKQLQLAPAVRTCWPNAESTSDGASTSSPRSAKLRSVARPHGCAGSHRTRCATERRDERHARRGPLSKLGALGSTTNCSASPAACRLPGIRATARDNGRAAAAASTAAASRSTATSSERSNRPTPRPPPRSQFHSGVLRAGTYPSRRCRPA